MNVCATILVAGGITFTQPQDLAVTIRHFNIYRNLFGICIFFPVDKQAKLNKKRYLYDVLDILCTSTLDNVPIGYAGSSSLKSFLKFWENIVHTGFLLVNWKLQACNFTKDRIILDVFRRIILSFSEKPFITTHLNGCSLFHNQPRQNYSECVIPFQIPVTFLNVSKTFQASFIFICISLMLIKVKNALF